MWPQLTSHQPELMAFRGCCLLLGALPANHPASLCPSSFPCEEGHVCRARRSAAEQCRSPRLKPSRTPNHPFTSLASVLSPGEMNLSYLPSPASSSQQRNLSSASPDPLFPPTRSCRHMCAGRAPLAPEGSEAQRESIRWNER